MKVRMTKKRSKALDIAISLDDLLYEKFRLLNKRLHEDIESLYRRPRMVKRVIQQLPDGNYLALPIIKFNVTPEGTELIVGEFLDSKKK